MSRRSRCRSTRGRASSRTRSASCCRISTGRTATSVCAPSPRSSKGLSRAADVLAAAYDALVGDRLSIDRLRGYANPMQPTNMNNELDDETVEAMMTATEEAYPIARKWFAGEGGAPRSRQARARRPVRADRRSARVQLGRGGRDRRFLVRHASRRGLRRSSARASKPATSTCCRGPARLRAPTARRCRRRSCRTCS